MLDPSKGQLMSHSHCFFVQLLQEECDVTVLFRNAFGVLNWTAEFDFNSVVDVEYLWVVVEAAADARDLEEVAQGLLKISVNELALQVLLLG